MSEGRAQRRKDTGFDDTRKDKTKGGPWVAAGRLAQHVHLDGRGLQQTESPPGFQAEPRFTGRQVTVGHWGSWLSARTSKVCGFKASHPQFTFSCRHDQSPQWDRPVLRLKQWLNTFTVLALEVKISRVPEFKHNTLCKWYHMFTKAEVKIHCFDGILISVTSWLYQSSEREPAACELTVKIQVALQMEHFSVHTDHYQTPSKPALIAPLSAMKLWS